MKRGLIAIGFISLLLASIVFPLFNISTHKVGASSSYPFSFKNQATISGNVGMSGIGNVTFVDKNVYNNIKYVYTPTSNTVCKPPSVSGQQYGITLTNSPNFSKTTIKATVDIGVQIGQNCTPISLVSPEYINNPVDSTTGIRAAEINFTWNGSTISTLYGEQDNVNSWISGDSGSIDSWQSERNAPGVYSARTSNNGSCGSYSAVLLGKGSTHRGTQYWFAPSGTTGVGPTKPASSVPALAPAYNSGSGCLIVTGSTTHIGIGGSQGAPAPGGGGGGSGPSLSCTFGLNISTGSAGSFFGSILNDVNPLNWLLCGLIDGMSTIVQTLDGQINSWLVIGTGGSTSTDNPNTVFSDNGKCGQTFTTSNGTESACYAYHQAFSKLADLALGLLVIVTLIVILAQIIGSDILDAYTIRKMLPRVIAGAIILTLLWPILQFFVTLSNDLGYGIGSLLWGPFKGLTNHINIFNDSFGSSILQGVVESLTIGALGFMGLLTFFGIAALAVFVAFVTLVFRQLIVILFIIFAPVAILAFILPMQSAQRLYKFWSDNLIKMLLMFPMIVGIIEIGHIFSAITDNAAGGGGGHPTFIMMIISLIAYFGPYFAIPATFKFSGSIMSGVGNLVNSQAAPLRGALSKARQNRTAQNLANLKNGTRYKGVSYLPFTQRAAQRFGTVTRGASTGMRGHFGLPTTTGKAARAQIEEVAADEAMKDHNMAAHRGDDNFLRAQVAGSADRARAAIIQHMTEQAREKGELGENESLTGKKLAEAQAEANRAVSVVNASGGFSTPRRIAAFKMIAAGGTGIRDLEDMTDLAVTAAHGDGHLSGMLMAQGVGANPGRFDLNPGSGDAFKLGHEAAEKGINDEDVQLQIARSKIKAAGSQSMYQIKNSAKGAAIKGVHRDMVKALSDNRLSSQERLDAYRFLRRYQMSGSLGGQTAENYAKEGLSSLSDELADSGGIQDVAASAIRNFAADPNNKYSISQIDTELDRERRLTEDQINAQQQGGAPSGEEGEG